ncbi:PREDICTED: uncharacterized protein LOC107334001 [Acropora digitifera]|uniref:uncharacterized protein LOC107334001 n=1 Tax=Acropora digitifera TaxID=70779 RepID=UPI00077A4B9A|nr:PREDICTED: uncharacterized protein LOC107334001 [Acropora digitifera]
MSHKEDSAQESSSSTESSSEESVYEDETLRSIQSDSSDEDIVPYADDPLADSAWTAEYEKEMKENEELEKELKHRLEGRVEVDVWCKCGKCGITLLQNISECYCCQELDGCRESLESDIVRQDLQDDETLKCITEHPGFQPVCLEKWSLRLAALKYKTKAKQHYKQKGNEESFLRSVAYRQFSRLVYGFLGHRRIPLPACAYDAIRRRFPANSQCEEFSGFDLGEMD